MNRFKDKNCITLLFKIKVQRNLQHCVIQPRLVSYSSPKQVSLRYLNILMAVSFCIPTRKSLRLPFFCIFPNTWFCQYGCILAIIIQVCSSVSFLFTLHFFSMLVMLNIFSCVYLPSTHFFLKLLFVYLSEREHKQVNFWQKEKQAIH